MVLTYPTGKRPREHVRDAIASLALAKQSEEWEECCHRILSYTAPNQDVAEAHRDFVKSAQRDAEYLEETIDDLTHRYDLLYDDEEDPYVSGGATT